MFISYENVKFYIDLSSSIEKHLFKQNIKKKLRFFGKFLGTICPTDPYLVYARKILSNSKFSTIVDIGANIGTTTLPLAKEFPNAQVFAIEPHPKPAAKLLKNSRKNRLNNLHIIPVAISQQSGFAQLYSIPSNSGGNRLSGYEGIPDYDKEKFHDSLTVPLASLRSIFETQGINHCDLLKIDVEGSEYHVIESLGDLLTPKIIPHIILEYTMGGYHKIGKTGWNLVSFMISQGYQCSLLGSTKKIDSEDKVPQIKKFTAIDLRFSESLNF